MTSCSSARSGARSPCQSKASSTTMPFGTIARLSRESSERSSLAAGCAIVGEQQVVGVAELAGHRLRVRIEQELGSLKRRPHCGPVLAAHPVAVELARPQAARQRVPDVLVAVASG